MALKYIQKLKSEWNMLTYPFIHRLSKILFSVVLFQLFLIIIHEPSSAYVADMLEYPAASAVVTLGASLLLEYILKSEENK